MNLKIEKAIEFNQVKEKWMELAVTEKAREVIREITYMKSESELRKCLRETTESRQLMEACGTPPISRMEGIEEILSIVRMEACLSASQLESLEKNLVGIRRLKEYLKRGKHYQIPLAFYDENLYDLESLQREIAAQIRNGSVDDRASSQLYTIRNDILKKETKMKEKVDTIIRANKDSLSDSFSTLRNGRLCIPVKKEYRHKITGSILDKSSTGNTVFIEPTAISAMYEELQLLKIEEENEVLRILYTLTVKVSEVLEEIVENNKTIAKLDFIFSKGKLSLDMDGIEPEINTERIIELKEARHPLMEKSICVPIDFSVGGFVRGVIITGPNTGGKTVAIKTVALNSMLAQCGLHVSCKKANICMNSNYLCDIGDGQNLAENLSTFSAHIKNVQEILNMVNPESLVIMDELGSGTDPQEGMGIAIAILEELRKSKCLFLVTTHYPDVKTYGEDTEGLINARMTFDKETLKPLYQLIIGESGESCAFYIAQKLGLSSAILDRAKQAAYGTFIASDFLEDGKKHVEQKKTVKIEKAKTSRKQEGYKILKDKYQLGDSVMVLPDKKIGIVCEKINEKGILRVQLQKKKIYINHTRVKLLVAAESMYPEDYDFSIVFDSVENRKVRHDMDRKYTTEAIVYEENR
jgi:dsDNA-specific endonuclease/ATPase MutS2